MVDTHAILTMNRLFDLPAIGGQRLPENRLMLGDNRLAEFGWVGFPVCCNLANHPRRS